MQSKVAKGERRDKWKRSFQFGYAEPHPIFDAIKDSESRAQRQMETQFPIWLCRTASCLRRQPTMTDLLLAWICFPFRAVLIDVVHGAWEACVADMENAVF